MAIRKRTWGELGERQAWIVDYRDLEGKRRHRTFERKRDAEDFRDEAGVQIKGGVHVADRASITVAEAGQRWIDKAEARRLQRTTVDQFKQHLHLHIKPFIGSIKLNRLTAPVVESFCTQLDKQGRSPALVRAIRVSLSGMLTLAVKSGLATRNVVREAGSNQADKHRGKRHQPVIPTMDEIRKLLAAAKGRWRPLLMTAVFTGLRSSELRGLRWDDVDLTKGELQVRQRADRYNTIGHPKTKAGERRVPLPPVLVQELRSWKLQCPKGEDGLGLVFPNGNGNIEAHVNIVERGLKPALREAGLFERVTNKRGVGKRDGAGKPIMRLKYTGLHCLRHFFASWCINRKEDGGLGLPAKIVQTRMGHSSIVVTLDTYGHLFPDNDDGTELAAAADRLVG